MIIFLSLLVSIVGLVIYLASDAKISTVGLHMFWVGLLAFLLQDPALFKVLQR